MTRLPIALFVLACVAYSTACGSDSGLNPEPAVEPSVFTTLQLSPASHLLHQGDVLRLAVVARDQRLANMTVDAVSYSSDAPEIAVVSDSGLVTAVSAGTAEISATVVVRGVTRQATMIVTVDEEEDGQEWCDSWYYPDGWC